MIYFFYGSDSYRIKEKINTVVKSYKAKHKSGMNFERFDLSVEADFEKFKNFIGAFSMFAEKKLALIENLFSAKNELQENFIEYAKKNLSKDQERFVVIGQELETGEKKDKYILRHGAELFKFLTGPAAESQEFETLEGVKLENWIKKQVLEKGGKIEPAAVRKIAAFVGSDLWQIGNETDKLVAYKKGQIISEKDVDLMVKAKIESDVFKTIDALAQRNRPQAFKFLHRQLLNGESEIYLLTMLVYQFRNLLLVKEQIEKGVPFYNLQKKLKLHPFVLRKTFEQSKNYSFSGLKRIYEHMLQMDVEIKSGRIEPKTALDVIVAEVAG